jgi:hypothetical protein
MTISTLEFDDLLADEWYQPEITNPKYGIQPFDIETERRLHRAMSGGLPFDDEPLRAKAENELVDSPWLSAFGRPMFDQQARSLIDQVAWRGDVRWLPLEIQTPSGVVDHYSVAAPSLEGGDYLSEPHTTRDPLGRPIRWVLDRSKLGNRQVFVFPGVSVGGLVMRGHLLRTLLDLGAVGVVVSRARVAPRLS